MEAITHFFSGIFIMAVLQYFIRVTWIVYMLLFPLCILAHFFIDSIVLITFHTPTPRPKDKIWLAWHVIVIVGSIFVAIVFTWVKFYLWALVAANIPDLYDWLFLRACCAAKKIRLPENPDLLPRYFMHYWIGRLRTRYFSRLPDWREQHKGIIIEVIIWASCFIVAWFLF
jgi:hypothetical protein